MQTEVAIVGAGLSGLYAASLLRRRGIGCVVLEARNRLGGRILSLEAEPSGNSSAPSNERYDLGPAWFWPEIQPRLQRLVGEFGLSAFPQYSEGAVLVERLDLQAPQRYERGSNSEPRSMRLQGGMRALIDALAATLPQSSIRLNAPVTGIARAQNEAIRIEIGGDAPTRIQANKVVLALPPRLFSGRIAFIPELPDPLRQAFCATATWMAGQAKVLAVYERAFWRERGFSGTASSFVGPMMEMHDASALDGRPALFGFVGISARERRALGPEGLKTAALAQFARLFGPEAKSPASLFLADWAQDLDTATQADWEPPSGHPIYGTPAGADKLWDGCLILAGSEASAEYGGYLEGALDAAERAAMLV